MTVAALTVGMFVVSIPLRFAQLQVPCTGVACASFQLASAAQRALPYPVAAYAAYFVVVDVFSVAA